MCLDPRLAIGAHLGSTPFHRRASAIDRGAARAPLVTLSVVAIVLLMYSVTRPLVNGVVTLGRNGPWVLAGRREALVLAVLLLVGAAVDMVLRLQATRAGASPQAWAFVLVPLCVGLTAAAVLSRRGHFVFGVHDHAFRDALASALRDAGYAYEVRVDGQERPSAVLLSGRWNGVEVSAKVRFGTGSLRGSCDSGRVVEHELAERMRATFDRRDADPHLWSAVTEIAVGFATTVVAVWAYL